MLDSMRARLALWHTATLAALLIAFAGASYVFLEHATMRRMDRYLAETATAFSAELQAERLDEDSNEAAVTAAVHEFHFRDLQIVVYDASVQRVMAGGDVAPGARQASRASARGRSPVDARALARVIRERGDVAPAFVTVPGGRAGYRAYATPVRLGADTYMVAVAESLRGQQETMEGLGAAYLVAIPLVLLLAAFTGAEA